MNPFGPFSVLETFTSRNPSTPLATSPLLSRSISQKILAFEFKILCMNRIYIHTVFQLFFQFLMYVGVCENGQMKKCWIFSLVCGLVFTSVFWVLGWFYGDLSFLSRVVKRLKFFHFDLGRLYLWKFHRKSIIGFCTDCVLTWRIDRLGTWVEDSNFKGSRLRRGVPYEIHALSCYGSSSNNSVGSG